MNDAVPRAMNNVRLALSSAGTQPLYAVKFLELAHTSLHSARIDALSPNQPAWKRPAADAPDPISADPSYPNLHATTARVLTHLSYPSPELVRLEHLTLHSFGRHARFSGLLGALALLGTRAQTSPDYPELRRTLLHATFSTLRLHARDGDVTSTRVGTYLKTTLGSAP